MTARLRPLASAFAGAVALQAVLAAIAADLVTREGFRQTSLFFALPYLLTVTLSALVLAALARWCGLRGLAVSTMTGILWATVLRTIVAARGTLQAGALGGAQFAGFPSSIASGAVVDLDALWFDALFAACAVALPWGLARRYRREPFAGPLHRVADALLDAIIGPRYRVLTRLGVALTGALLLQLALTLITHSFAGNGGAYGTPFDIGQHLVPPPPGPAEVRVVPTTFSEVVFIANVIATTVALFLLGRWTATSGTFAASAGAAYALYLFAILFRFRDGYPLDPSHDTRGFPLVVVRSLPLVPDRAALWVDCLFVGLLAALAWLALSRLRRAASDPSRQWRVTLLGAAGFQLALSLVTSFAPAWDGSFGAPFRAGSAAPFGLFAGPRITSVDPLGIVANLIVSFVVFHLAARWVGTYGGLLALGGSLAYMALLFVTGVLYFPIPARDVWMPAVIGNDMLFGALLACALWVAVARSSAWYRRMLVAARA